MGARGALACALGLLLASSAWAEMVVEGSAEIVAGNLAEARELATRRALARAAESRGATVSAASLLQPDAVLESIQVRSSACADVVEQVSERQEGGRLTVVLRVSVSDGPDCQPACRRAYVNRVLVLGFALEHPEQKRSREHTLVSRMTAVELAKKIRQRPILLSDFSSDAFPYASPARAPMLHHPGDGGEPPITLLAKQHRAQYVLSGIYRDFGLEAPGLGKPGVRRIAIEAFVHDGVNGGVLAQKRFAATATGHVLLEGEPSVGTPQFYRGDFGRVWGRLLDDVAAWAERSAACLPFSARILRAEGRRLQIDAGAESGLSAGDTLLIHGWKEPPVTGLNGQMLGAERKIRASAAIREVYPRFSVIEISDPPDEPAIKPGDVIFTL